MKGPQSSSNLFNPQCDYREDCPGTKTTYYLRRAYSPQFLRQRPAGVAFSPKSRPRNSTSAVWSRICLDMRLILFILTVFLGLTVHGFPARDFRVGESRIANRQKIRNDYASPHAKRSSDTSTLVESPSNDSSVTDMPRKKDPAQFKIPTYIIDMSLPPEERWVQMAKDYVGHPAMAKIKDLFDQVVGKTGYPIGLIHGVSNLLLRRLYSPEETKEIKGFADVVGLDLYYLIAFNTFLDTFMGCTSGAANVKDSKGEMRLLHFRTLDWGMDELRQIMVTCEFVEDGKPVATTVGYAGYVGVLTGVRKGLSESLNLRPNHNDYSFWGNVNQKWHLLQVLLGNRPSLASTLRTILFSYDGESAHEVAEQFSHVPSAAAYITFCDGKTASVIEKDFTTGLIRDAEDFLTVTNHDMGLEEGDPSHCPAYTEVEEEFRNGSLARKECVSKFWQKTARKGKEGSRYVSQANLVKWMETEPVKNDITQYAVIMDPTEGRILYSTGYNATNEEQ
jgi:beta subunit of N-acylethanolamine-hydrolyzing acid amidase